MLEESDEAGAQPLRRLGPRVHRGRARLQQSGVPGEREARRGQLGELARRLLAEVPVAPRGPELLGERGLRVGLYPVVTFQYSSTTLYQVFYHTQSLFFESANRISPYLQDVHAARQGQGAQVRLYF